MNQEDMLNDFKVILHSILGFNPIAKGPCYII